MSIRVLAIALALFALAGVQQANARNYDPATEKFWEVSENAPTYRKRESARSRTAYQRRGSRASRTASIRGERYYRTRETRNYHGRRGTQEARFYDDTDNNRRSSSNRRIREARGYEVSSSAKYNAGPRPGRWCGWWMRTQRGGGPELNLARNWRGWGSPSSAQVGAVVVWPNHVGEIVGRAANGQWIVRSGNDGGRVRERARSVSGAVFRMG